MAEPQGECPLLLHRLRDGDDDAAELRFFGGLTNKAVADALRTER